MERLGREMLRLFRGTLSEMKQPATEWPALVPILQNALHNAPSSQRKRMAPVIIFLGHQPTTPLSVYKLPSTAVISSFSDTLMERYKNLNDIQTVLEEIHPIIDDYLQESRKASRLRQSKGKAAQFEQEDFVLVAREEFHKNEKLCLRWRGPRRVNKIVSDWIVNVENLGNGACQDVHTTRLRFYSDSRIGTTAIFPHVLYSERCMPV